MSNQHNFCPLVMFNFHSHSNKKELSLNYVDLAGSMANAKDNLELAIEPAKSTCTFFTHLFTPLDL